MNDTMGLTFDSTKTVTANLTWEMKDPKYSSVVYGCPTCFKDVVTVTPTWTIDETAAGMDDSITTVNYDAMTTMYKIMNPPKYSKAWQGAAMAIDKMNM